MQEAQAPLPAGTVIYEHYIVESLLGKGDFGNVYLVRDQRDKGGLFAFVEVINLTEQDKYRFALDYVSLAPIEQSSLPDVQYVFNDNKLSQTYMLMQYIQEPNLELLRLHQAEKRFPFEEVMVLMTPVMQAVIHLHHRSLPVLHRNIQPANIIVPQKGDAPVLVMLGIVREYEASSTTLPYFAPGYGTPEQYKGEASTRTDIYGLSATWYTLITGIIPPDALSRSARLSKGESDPVKPVNEVIPAIPLFIAEAIQRAMSINPEDRFSSVEQFWEAIGSPERQPLLSLSHPIPSTPPPALVPMPKLPDTPHLGKLNGSRPAVSGQADERPTLVPVLKELPTSRAGRPSTLWSLTPRQGVAKLPPIPALAHVRTPRTPLRVPHARKLSVVFIVFALLISLGIGAGFLLRTRSLPAAHSAIPAPTVIRSTPTPTSTATSVSSIYPTLTGTYTGTIYDVSANVPTNMSLTSIQQNQANISGYLALGPSIHGSGPFRGTIDTIKHLQFIVTDTAGNAMFFFEGNMRSGNSLTGDYYRCSPASPVRGGRCDQASGSYGIWSVVPHS